MEKTTLLAEALLKTHPKETVQEVIEMLTLLEQQEKKEAMQLTPQEAEAVVKINKAWEEAWLF